MVNGKEAYEYVVERITEFKKVNNIDDIWYRGEGGMFNKMVPSMYRSGVLPQNSYTHSPFKKLKVAEKVDIISYERWLHRKIIERSTYEHADGHIHNGLLDWDTVFYQQHYGLPTRFIDWSYALETGLYFATANEGKNDAALWLLDPRKLNELTRNAYEHRAANDGEYEDFLLQDRFHAQSSYQ